MSASAEAREVARAVLKGSAEEGCERCEETLGIALDEFRSRASVLPSYVAPEPGEHATVSITIGGKAMPSCLWCGCVRPRDGWVSKCRGRVKIGLRATGSITDAQWRP